MQFYHIILANLLAISASSHLRCYDCDPNTSGSCRKIPDERVKVQTCRQRAAASSRLERQIRDGTELELLKKHPTSTSFECYTLELRGEKSGVYRGCAQKGSDELSCCESIKEYVGADEVTDCWSCSEDRCNRGNFTSGATLGSFHTGVFVGVLVLPLLVLEF